MIWIFALMVYCREEVKNIIGLNPQICVYSTCTDAQITQIALKVRQRLRNLPGLIPHGLSSDLELVGNPELVDGPKGCGRIECTISWMPRGLSQGGTVHPAFSFRNS